MNPRGRVLFVRSCDLPARRDSEGQGRGHRRSTALAWPRFGASPVFLQHVLRLQGRLGCFVGFLRMFRLFYGGVVLDVLERVLRFSPRSEAHGEYADLRSARQIVTV